jgi:two-component system, NtrC family, response regulator GlrR
MKQPNLLLLDFNPVSNLGNELRHILESTFPPEVQLHQEGADRFSPRHLAELIARLKPTVALLVTQFNPARRVQTFFESLSEKMREPPVIVVTEEDEPDAVFEAFKLGAVDFITTPLKPINIVPRVRRFLTRELSPFRQGYSQHHNLIGVSPSFTTEINKIPLIAKCDAGVMISGETGTGKELCARAIHNLSSRAGRPFIPVNCGAIPIELAENELFGHERGAFTNAATAQPGLIAEADGGTLFLDELDSLPLLAQVKLLRFLQEREYRPLGSSKTRHADVRVVAATNIDFEKAINAGQLRQDLYFRLNIIPITLPPLRNRLEDIQLLSDYFCSKYAIAFNKPVSGFSPSARQKLMMHDWPGNVRELEHTIQRAIALCELSIIRAEDIQLSSLSTTSVFESFKEAKNKVVTQFERNYLQSLLLTYQGNISKAADAAQKNRRAFWELLQKHNLNARDFTRSQSMTNPGSE